MHSVLYRVNAILTFSILVLAIICTLASFSERLHNPHPDIQLDVVRYDGVWKIARGPFRGNDEGLMTLNIKANLSSVFSWNTKQLFVFVAMEYVSSKNSVNRMSVWDIILQSPDEAYLDFPEEHVEYPFMDQGNHLRGLPFNLTMYWNIMPITGGLETQHRTFSGFQIPQNYSKRSPYTHQDW